MGRKTIGIVLLVLGILMMVYTGFNYVTTNNILNVGDIHADWNDTHHFQWSPLVCGLLFIGGIIVTTNSKNSKI